MDCEFCGASIDDAVGRYGCPNCLGEATSRADQIRALLAQAGISQLEAARRLEVSGRTMRGWCADKPPAPAYAVLALRHLIECEAAVRG